VRVNEDEDYTRRESVCDDKICVRRMSERHTIEWGVRDGECESEIVRLASTAILKRTTPI
jgi:hypothetical protein